jgi:putative hydrolase of the HAD superfamily
MHRDPESIFIWDFDGTLGFREGMWSGAIADLVRRLRPDLGLEAEAFRPHLQSGFPWHDWQMIRPPSQPADDWWERLRPVILNAVMRGGGLHESEAGAVAAGVRSEYLRLEAWSLAPDVLPFFATPFARTMRHVILSNHVPE